MARDWRCFLCGESPWEMTGWQETSRNSPYSSVQEDILAEGSLVCAAPYGNKIEADFGRIAVLTVEYE